MSSWTKVPHSGKGKAPPPWLEIRTGIRETSYRVRYRRNGVKLEQTLDGEFEKWSDAAKVGEALISKARFGDKPKGNSFVKSEDLCDEIVKLKEPLDRDTYEQAEIFFRVHIKPFLRGECAYENDGGEFHACKHRTYLESGATPYAADLNPTKWLAYKTHYRLHRPKGSIENHWKFWGMLCKYAFDKQVLTQKFKLAFDADKESLKKDGQLIPDEAIRAMVANANRTWKDRIRLGRMTGQRPGVIRLLRRDQVDLQTGVCTVEKADSKNRNSYKFLLPEPALDILRARVKDLPRVTESPYFFPSKVGPSKPMEKHLRGWHTARTKAGITRDYTPHDLRHTYLTQKFKTVKNPAIVCYSCDISLEEAMETYIHFEAEDTRGLAEETSKEAVAWNT